MDIVDRFFFTTHKSGLTFDIRLGTVQNLGQGRST